MRADDAGTGISWYNESYHNWQDYMAAAGTTSCGPNENLTAPTGLVGVSSWALRSRMEGVASYGWNWETGASGGGAATATSKMSLNATSGNLGIVGTFLAGDYISTNSSNNRSKFRLWNNSSSFGIGMSSGFTYGHLGGAGNEYAMTFQMDSDSDRGFWFGTDADGSDDGAMALTIEGRMNIAKSLSVGEGRDAITSPSTTPLYVYGSGSTVLDIQGSQGQLFSITDDLTGDLLNISDISGIPILSVNASGTSSFDGAVDIDGDLHVTGSGKLTVGDFRLEGSGIVADVGMTLQVDGGSVNAVTIDNAGSTTFSGYTYFPNYLFHAGDTNTRIGFDTSTITLRGDTKIVLDTPVVEVKHSTAPEIKLRREDSSIVDGESIGTILFQGDDPSATNTGAAIKGQAAGTWGMGTPNYYPSELLLQTAKTNTLITALRIDEDQHTHFAGNIVLTGTGRIQGIDTVSATTDAANKSYVDGEITELKAAGSTNIIIGAPEVTYINSGTSYGDYFLLSQHNPGVSNGEIKKVRAGYMRLNKLGTPDAQVSMGSQKITSLATPVASTDGANKAYVDSSNKMFLNWKMFHDTTSIRTLYKDGKTANFPWAYSNIIMPFKGYLTTISFAHNPFSPFTSAPTGNSASMYCYVNQSLKQTVTVSYGSSAGQVIEFDFGTATNFNKNDKVSLRFQANGIWRYVTMGILFQERA